MAISIAKISYEWSLFRITNRLLKNMYAEDSQVNI